MKKDKADLKPTLEFRESISLDNPADVDYLYAWAELAAKKVRELETDIQTLLKFKSAWDEQKGWLERTRDSGQRQRSVAALDNMKDIERRLLSEHTKDEHGKKTEDSSGVETPQ